MQLHVQHNAKIEQNEYMKFKQICPLKIKKSIQPLGLSQDVCGESHTFKLMVTQEGTFTAASVIKAMLLHTVLDMNSSKLKCMITVVQQRASKP
jgi:hypothetical protein